MNLKIPHRPLRSFVQRRFQAAFSLVEVALAVGIVGFGMTVILGCLPVGLLSVKDSKIQSAKANIARQLRGELQQISFFAGQGAEADSTSIDALANKEYFYAQDGTRVDVASDAYYLANFTVTDATVTGSSSFLPVSARSVEVSLTYPQAAPKANREETSFSLFLARQRGQ